MGKTKGKSKKCTDNTDGAPSSTPVDDPQYAKEKAKAKARPKQRRKGKGNESLNADAGVDQAIKVPQQTLLRWFAPVLPVRSTDPVESAEPAMAEAAAEPAGATVAKCARLGEPPASSFGPEMCMEPHPERLPPLEDSASTAPPLQASPSQTSPSPAPSSPAQLPKPARISALRQLPLDAHSRTSRFEGLGAAAWGQYNSTYAKRLEALRDPVSLEAQRRWAADLPRHRFIPRILEMDSHTEVVLVGIISKDMRNRPKVLALYRDWIAGNACEENEVMNFCSDADEVWLEDEGSRISLQLAREHVSKLATGLVVAVRGYRTCSGAFCVRDMCLARRVVPSPFLPPITAGSSLRGPFVAFVSGFALGSASADVAARRRALDFLVGRCERKWLKQLSSSVHRLVVCGGVFAAGGALVALDEADSMLAELASVMPVDFMPGPHEPTNMSLPQLAPQRGLFPRASVCEDFTPVTNPYDCSVLGSRLVGHSGQPVDDLLRCTRLASPLAALDLSLAAAHLAPTAPDTLPAPPCTEEDPFVLEAWPSVLFSGGHQRLEFAFRPGGSSGTLCLCVPAFCEQPSVVLVNMRDVRDVRVQDFAAP